MTFNSEWIIIFDSMAKQKNTNNKKKHTKLLNQKKTKKQLAKELNKARLKEIIAKANESKD